MNELMIWTPNGVWLQSVDDFGVRRLSFVGKQERGQVLAFCAETGIRYHELSDAERAGERDLPAVRAKGAPSGLRTKGK